MKRHSQGGIGCVTEPAWQNRSRNLMLVSHMRIGFEIHMEGVLYSPWVLLHLRTLTWLAPKNAPQSQLQRGDFLAGWQKTAISIQATTGVYVETVNIPPILHRSACVGNESLPPQFPFSRTGAPSRGASSFPCGQERAKIKFSSQRLSGRRICHAWKCGVCLRLHEPRYGEKGGSTVMPL